jgi:hypothetical protein
MLFQLKHTADNISLDESSRRIFSRFGACGTAGLAASVFGAGGAAGLAAAVLKACGTAGLAAAVLEACGTAGLAASVFGAGGTAGLAAAVYVRLKWDIHLQRMRLCLTRQQQNSQ